jgi:MFS family permease
VIEWHVLGMFAPSFVTGSIIKRFGVIKVILTGTFMMALCAGVNYSGFSVTHFWVGLVLWGVGWTFMFIGGTTLLTEVCQESERTVAQGTNEVLVYSSNTTASLGAGLLLHQLGWQAMNLLALPFLLVVVAMCAALARRKPSDGQPVGNT